MNAVTGVGNELNNKIVGDNLNNVLAGLAGNDTIDGGFGADTLDGGAGDDTYYVDDVKDIVKENYNSGNDTIIANLIDCSPSGPVRQTFGLEEWRISGSS